MAFSTVLLSEEVLNEFYRKNSSFRRIGKNDSAASSKQVRLMRLAPLSSSEATLSSFQNEISPIKADVESHKKRKQPREDNAYRSTSSHNTDDIHYLSNLQHRIAGISGDSPSPSKSSSAMNGVSPLKPLPKLMLPIIQEDVIATSLTASSEEHSRIHRKLHTDIEQTQLKLLQESSSIKSIMKSVIEQYESMQTLLANSFFHRKELYEKVNKINDTYLIQFETLLEEIMKLQRTKFKSQSKLIEELQKEHNALYADFSIQSQALEALKMQYAQLESDGKLFEQQSLHFLQQIEEGNAKYKQLEFDHHQDEIEIKRLRMLLAEFTGQEPGGRKNKYLYEQEIRQLEEKNKTIAANYGQLQSEHRSAMTEMKAKNEFLRKEIVDLEQQMKNMRVFQNLEKIQDFQYPKEDACTQTEINPWDGLWDVSNGWILPIRKTTAARIRWRNSVNFAKCQLCRGVGKNILLVIKLLTQIEKSGQISTSSDAVVLEKLRKQGKSSQQLVSISAHNNKLDIMHDESNQCLSNDDEKEIYFHEKERFFYCWKLSDDLILFIQSLPKSIVALNPKNTILWVVKRSFVILHYKYLFDIQEDESIFNNNSCCDVCNKEEQYMSVNSNVSRYHPQSMMTFVIEQFLRNAADRHEAERMFFEYLLNLKEYYLQHPLLFYIARCFGLIDGLTSFEQTLLKEELMKNRQALINKKEKELQAMKAREKSKQKAKLIEDHDKLLAQPEFRIYYEDDFQITPYSFNEQILFHSLFFKYCCLQEPYTGVYSIHIQSVRQKVKKVESFALDFQKVTAKFWCRTMDSLCRNKSNSEISSAYNIPENNRVMKLLPQHLFVDTNSLYQFYIPLDRAVHVVHAIIEVEQLPFAEQISIYRKLEDYVKVLSIEDGSLNAAEGMHSIIRSSMRLLLYSCKSGSPQGQDISTWEEVIAHYQHPLNVNNIDHNHDYVDIDIDSEKAALPPQSNESNRKFRSGRNRQASDESLEEHESQTIPQLQKEMQELILMVNLDQFMIIVGEILRQKSLTIEKKIMKAFEQGDVNHDNVLSYEEFQSIIDIVIPNYSYRKVLQMFREALIAGEDGNNECIGPSSFLAICKKYQLFTLMDLSVYQTSCLSALCGYEKRKRDGDSCPINHVATDSNVPIDSSLNVTFALSPTTVNIPIGSGKVPVSAQSDMHSAKAKKRSVSTVVLPTKKNATSITSSHRNTSLVGAEIATFATSLPANGNVVLPMASSHHLPIIPSSPTIVLPVSSSTPNTSTTVISANALTVNEMLSKEYHNQVIAALQKKKLSRLSLPVVSED